ncbi:hypothetical protein C7S16_6188 [Burkholderia thailandensis]|uniref:Uncharacterized protein n=1 Tax=Burkholderia thailandensis TaxID=57975 RepID=A0AAW9CR87_BURTH|nr:hypothetical protein [Burkholderia thailandensis]MDW9253540.1 hypothetical protein [Burkholderia thailandensis]
MTTQSRDLAISRLLDRAPRARIAPGTRIVNRAAHRAGRG